MDFDSFLRDSTRLAILDEGTPNETILHTPFGQTYEEPKTMTLPEGATEWDPQDDWFISKDFCPRMPPKRADDDSDWEFHGVIHSISVKRAQKDSYDGDRDGGKLGDRGWVFTGNNGFGGPQHLFVSGEAARALGELLLSDNLPDYAPIFVTRERS